MEASVRHMRWRQLRRAAALCAATGFLLWLLRRARQGRELVIQRHVALLIGNPYGRAVFEQALARLGLKVDNEAPVQIADFADMDWDRLLKGDDQRCRTSCLYNRSSLVRKAMLAHYLAKRKVTDVLPPGFAIDLEDESDFDTLRKRLSAMSSQDLSQVPGHQWIAKASNANRGEKLFMARTIEEIIQAVRPTALEGGVAEWVVQRYVSPPLLIKGLKFHVRAHFLVSGCPVCGCTRAWLHKRHHVLLLASEQYSAHKTDDEQKLAHLTNHCLNVDHENYNEAKQILPMSALDNLQPGMSACVLRRMEEALAKTLPATAAAAAGFAALPQCFELFGADFTLEDRGSDEPGVYLLEVNAGPDLGVFGSAPAMREQCVSMAEDVLRVAVLPHLGRSATDAFCAPENCGACNGSIGGFGSSIWTLPPRTSSCSQELEGFKRRISIAGRWAKSLHESKGIEVRGVQSSSAK